MKTLLPTLIALLALASPALAGGEGWLHNLEEAQKKAKAEGKDILIDFTGSDWCGWCIKLKKEVWDTETWKAEGGKRFVMVELDYPRRTPQSEETKKYNKAMAAKFGVQGYPTVAVLDAEGRPYAMTGYQAGGPEAYIKHLDDFASRKGEIKDALAKAESEGSAKALDGLMDKLSKWRVAFGYSNLQAKIVELDPKNEQGLGLKHAKALAASASAAGDEAALEKHLAQIEAMDPAAAKAMRAELKGAALIQELESKLGPLAQKNDWAGALKIIETEYADKYTEGAEGQVVKFFSGICKLRSGDKSGGITDLKAARDLDPNSEMGGRISQILQQVGG